MTAIVRCWPQPLQRFSIFSALTCRHALRATAATALFQQQHQHSSSDGAVCNINDSCISSQISSTTQRFSNSYSTPAQLSHSLSLHSSCKSLDGISGEKRIVFQRQCPAALSRVLSLARDIVTHPLALSNSGYAVLVAETETLVFAISASCFSLSAQPALEKLASLAK